jgi:hypothetical protein
MKKLFNRRTLVTVTVAVAVGVASAAGVALAGGGGSGKPQPPASTSADNPRASSDIVAAARSALDELVSAGTITQSQEDAVLAQVQAGTVYPDQLIANGTVNAAQMNAVNDKLRQVKESFAPH